MLGLCALVAVRAASRRTRSLDTPAPRDHGDGASQRDVIGLCCMVGMYTRFMRPLYPPKADVRIDDRDVCLVLYGPAVLSKMKIEDRRT
jgi:hypothetical protein